MKLAAKLTPLFLTLAACGPPVAERGPATPVTEEVRQDAYTLLDDNFCYQRDRKKPNHVCLHGNRVSAEVRVIISLP